MSEIIDIKSIRGELSQAQLAELLGVEQATISRWETGKSKPSGPALVLLKQIATEKDAANSNQAALAE